MNLAIQTRLFFVHLRFALTTRFDCQRLPILHFSMQETQTAPQILKRTHLTRNSVPLLALFATAMA